MKKITTLLIVTIVVLLTLLWFGGRWMLSRSVADYSGEIPLGIVEHAVEITFDGKGIPQIWAETDADLFAALGWVHASERLFQMELVRRLARGELSEIFGDATYEVDLFQRKIGFFRKAKADVRELQPRDRQLVQKYCDGINAWIAHKKILPPEFVLLRFKPAKWQPEDCLAILFYQTWFSHALMDRDQSYAALIRQFGADLEKALQEYKSWSPPTVDRGILQSLFRDTSFPLQITLASNSWVVAPQKSVSGAALHASDPHLLINQVPAPWYIAGLHSGEGTHALGVTSVGIPFVAMGHTANTAYAFTVASVDVIDYYLEQRNPQEPQQVLSARGYEDLTSAVEEIKIKGEDKPRRVTIYRSENGPVIASDSLSCTTLKWAGFDFSLADMVHAALQLHHAENFAEFRRLVTSFGALDANWTYSDRKGNIGYQLGIPIPVRHLKDTYLQQRAEDKNARWHGYVELDKTPFALNPAKGWLATCNNQVVPEPWLKELPGFYDPYRITRATALLSAKDKYSLDDFKAMQMDRISGVALRWKELCARGAGKLGRTQTAAEIRDWDGSMGEDSRTAALFALWWRDISEALFHDDLEDWHDGAIVKEEVLTAELTAVIDDRTTPDVVETIDDISARACETALQQAQNRRLGEISELRISHPLARAKVLDMWLHLNRGPFENGGDNGTLNANFNRFDDKSGKFETVAGPSMRFLLDWSDVDGFTININLGQSGNPFSPHYDDFLDMNRRGERWNVPFSKESVYKRSVSVLKLVPDNSSKQ